MFARTKICTKDEQIKQIELVKAVPCHVYYNDELKWKFKDFKKCEAAVDSMTAMLEKAGFYCADIDVDKE